MGSLLLLIFVLAIQRLSLADDVKSRPIQLVELEEYIRQMDTSNGWKKEFDSLPAPQTALKSWNYASQPENIAKHRYPPPEDNLLTYDETRVILYRIHGDQKSDFINANWIDSYKDKRRYIGTQCPIESTVADFYRMIWQHNLHEVVMLASPHDIEKNKCVKYFPDDSAMFGDLEVSLQRKMEFVDIVVRIYSLKRGGSIRVLVHHHFVSWPDLGVPQDPKQLLNLIRKYRSSDTYSRAWPLLIHCSAGVGRTGTFLLTDAMFDMAENEDHVDFLKHLWMIRHQRISLVEKPEQYALAHKVILQAYKEGLFDKSKPQKFYNPQQVGMMNETNETTPTAESMKKTNIVIVDSKLGDQEIIIRLTGQESCSTI